MNDFKKLKVWERSIDLTVNIYKITENFPDEEKFGLTNQLRRASVSISSNIAEGAGRNSSKEFNNFLGYAGGSSCEVETQLVIAERLEYIKNKELEIINKEVNEIRSMIFGLKKSLNTSN